MFLRLTFKVNLEETISQTQDCGKFYRTNDPTSSINKWMEGRGGRKERTEELGGKREKEKERERTATD